MCLLDMSFMRCLSPAFARAISIYRTDLNLFHCCSSFNVPKMIGNYKQSSAFFAMILLINGMHVANVFTYISLKLTVSSVLRVYTVHIYISIAINKKKPQFGILKARNSVYHYLTIGIITFSSIRMVFFPSKLSLTKKKVRPVEWHCEVLLQDFSKNRS